MFKPKYTHSIGINYTTEKTQISPHKRAPRNAKSKHGREARPVEVGQEYEVDITQMSPNGEGIGNYRGCMIFVRNTKVGDHVKVKAVRVDSVSADAEIVDTP